jgi:hypothetical protein
MSDLATKAALLRERMEAGELPRARLTLGDALGDERCRLALGRPEPEPAEAESLKGESLEFWGRRLGRFGPAPMLRISVALARHLAERTQTEDGPHDALQGGLRAADRFLAHTPGPLSLLEECQQAAQALARETLDTEGSARSACLTLLPVLRAILDVLEGGAPNRMLLDAHYVRVLQYAESCQAPLDEVQAAVRAEVAAWALAKDE